MTPQELFLIHKLNVNINPFNYANKPLSYKDAAILIKECIELVGYDVVKVTTLKNSNKYYVSGQTVLFGYTLNRTLELLVVNRNKARFETLKYLYRILQKHKL